MRAMPWAMVLAALLPGVCFAAAPKADGTEKGAKALLAAFLKPGADRAALSAALRPTSADFKAIFDAESAAKAEKGYKASWDKGLIVIKPKAEETVLVVQSATSEDLKSGSAKATALPGHYSDIAMDLKKGLRIYHFHFVEKGKEKENGTAYDGLVFVNGHWVLVPKPWRVLGSAR